MGSLYIERKLRPCYIFNKYYPNDVQKALFHMWGHKSNGYTTTEHMVAIVELENGRVIEVETSKIRFIDNQFVDYVWNDEKEKPVGNNSVVTYGDIFKEFLSSTGINQALVSDYRPCGPPYFESNIPMAIIVYLKDDNELIYIKKGD